MLAPDQAIPLPTPSHAPRLAHRLPVAWVVPGPLRQVTGGYLYDARIVDGLRAAGWWVGVVNIQSRGWPLDLPAGRRMTRALAGVRWGAVVVDELAHPALTATLLVGGLRRALGPAPLIVLVHHLRCSEPAGWPRRALARLVEGRLLHAADLVVCTSATTAQTVRPLTRTGTFVEVVRPGRDTHGTRQPAPRPAGPPRLTDEAGPLRVLLVGHWTPRKGILDALAALERTPPTVTLDLVGEQDRDPAYAARVWAALRRQPVAGRVRAHGRVASEALTRLYAEADAFLLPSTHEGYGMALAEALAAGLPVVATRAGAIPEVVRDGAEAELVRPGDVVALAAALERLAATPAERVRRASLARQRAAELPDWPASMAAFREILERVAVVP